MARCVLLILVSAKRRAPAPSASGSAKGSSSRPAKGPKGPKGPKKPTTPKQKMLTTLKWMAASFLVLCLVAVGGFLVLYNSIDLPDPNKDFKTQTSFVYYGDGKELGRFEQQNRQSISIDTMPATVKDAVVAAENESFWTDKGIDPKGIVRALFNNASGSSTQGASTITQQYIKIMYLNQERSYQRKVKEAVLALKIQRQMTKEEVLEGYLNTIFFGRSAYGIQAAAKAYFNVPASKLNLRQSAALASMINNPNNLDPAKGKKYRKLLKDRYDYTLGRMLATGKIDRTQHDAAVRKLPKFPEISAESRLGGQKGHMLTLVRAELNDLGFSNDQIDRDGLKITTTFDPQVMEAAKNTVQENRPEGFGDKQLHIGAATVDVKTGAVRGFYGGQDFLDSQINWAATGGMAGSTMKAFANVAAVKAGFSIKATFDGNSPYEFPGGLQVNNQGFHDYSRVSMMKATESSINTAYMDMTQAMVDGPREIFDAARAAGIPGPKASKKFPGIPSTSPDFSPEDTLVSLGRARVSPINMANAYATIANGGQRSNAHVIQKVVDRDGEELYRHKNTTKRVIDEDIAADVSYTLQRTVSYGSGTRALALGRPAAGKTGTATNSKDQVSSMWFAGFTPQLSTAVMYVRGDGDDGLDDWLDNSTGGYYPTLTWTSLMQAASEGMESEDFPDPVYVDGDDPSTGHSYVPPAQSTQPVVPQNSPPPPKPSKKPSPEPSALPTEKPTQSPTQPPTVDPTPTQPTTPPPTTPPPTTPPVTTPPVTTPPVGGEGSGGGSGGGGGGGLTGGGAD